MIDWRFLLFKKGVVNIFNDQFFREKGNGSRVFT